jgi:uncharacterized protein (DUF1330 family)
MNDFGLIVILARIHRRDAFGAYVQALKPLYQRFDAKYLVMQSVADLHEQNSTRAPLAMVVSLWQSLPQIEAFWYGEDYQRVAALRAGTGEFSVKALAGCNPQRLAQAWDRLRFTPALAAASAAQESSVVANSHGLILEQGCTDVDLHHHSRVELLMPNEPANSSAGSSADSPLDSPAPFSISAQRLG